jgi:hypothetical protein
MRNHHEQCLDGARSDKNDADFVARFYESGIINLDDPRRSAATVEIPLPSTGS